MKTIGVYVPGPGSEYRRVGRFSLDETGQAVASAVDAAADRQLKEFAAHVAPPSMRRRVEPSEGEVFLAAMFEQFRGSSYVRVVDEE